MASSDAGYISRECLQAMHPECEVAACNCYCHEKEKDEENEDDLDGIL